MAPKRAMRSNLAPEITNTTSVTNARLQAMINQGVTAALVTRDANKNTNGNDSHILGVGVRRTEQTACECTYIDFLKCQPLKFKGTEGVAGLSQWFERMVLVFHISNCTVENQVRHFKRECQKLKNNNNRGNQVGGGNAPAKVYPVGHAGINPDSNVMTGLVGYYRRFIEGLFEDCQSMTNLTEKELSFNWGDKPEAAFSLLLKQKLCQCANSGFT
ncbi:hypothetical protein Tco_1285127 [Tanacetum coccineum]